MNVLKLGGRCLVVVLGLSLVGCVVEDRRPYEEPPPAVSPMLVDVDTNQTMDARGGDGVGVFIEYGAGGHWHIWWTCDTNVSRVQCDFSVNATAATSAFSNLDVSALPDGFATQPMPNMLAAQSTTTTGVSEISFDTDAGATITLSASVGGVAAGSYFFFVQAGKVNGGFGGNLTNPLMLRGTLA